MSEMQLSGGSNGATVLNWSSGVTQKLTDSFFDCVRQKIEDH
ncbi:MAG TPA: hypothetical protein VGS96_10755 [Thermoanaerobaculia bacterium]|jgi:hypothetical protein|nr:hypothetical protein [Thermoanaerobaculia bacterium]